VKVGAGYRVPTADLLRALGIDPPSERTGEPDQAAAPAPEVVVTNR
jgi:hypothetical protein